MLKKIKYLLIITLLFTSMVLNAQDINFGLRITNLSKQERETFSARVNNTRASNMELHSYDPELIAEKINRKNIFQRINVGISIGQTNQNNMAVFNSTGKSVTLNNTQTGLGYSLVYGIGKIYYFNKLTFRFGIEMSGRYFTPGGIESTTEYFDSTNVKYQTYKSSTTYHSYFIFGANLISTIHYNFYKSFSVGIEFGNGMYYVINKGTEVRTDELYGASGTLLATRTKSTHNNTNSWHVAYLRSSFSIYYSF